MVHADDESRKGRETGADNADGDFCVTRKNVSVRMYSQKNRLRGTYPSILILIKARETSFDCPVMTISAKRTILAVTATPPAPKITITRIFFFVEICRVQVKGNGKMRMIISLTTLTTASAKMIDVWSKHVPSILWSQNLAMGLQIRILTMTAGM